MSAPQARAVIFDLDGVLVDSERHWEGLETEFFSRACPGWTAAHQRAIVGMPLQRIYAYVEERFAQRPTREEFLAAFGAMFRTVYGERCGLCPGAREILAALRSRKVPLALATSTHRGYAAIALSRFSLAPYFAVFVYGDDVARGKPEPDIFLEAAGRLGVAPGSCLVVEDSRNGVLAAKAAGMPCVGISGSPGQDVSAADAVVASLEEIEATGLLPQRS